MKTNYIKKITLKKMFKFIVCIICLIGAFFCDKYFKNRVDNFEKLTMTQDCIVSINEEAVFQGDIKKFDFKDRIEDNDTIGISFNVRNNKFTNGIIGFLCINAQTKVFLDNECIYSYGECVENKANVIGNYYVRAFVDERCNNKKVDIKMKVCSNNIFLEIPTVYIMDAQDFDKMIIADNIWNIFMSVLLFIVPVVGLLCLIDGVGITKDNKELLVLLGLSLATSFWLAGCFNILDYITDNYALKYYIEYMGMYLMLIFGILFVYERSNEESKDRYYLNVLLTMLLVYIAISLILQVFEIAYFAEYSFFYYIYAVIALIIAVKVEIKKNKSVKKANKNMAYVFLIMTIFVVRILVNIFVNKENTILELEYVSLIIGIVVMTGVVVFVKEYMRTFLLDTEKQSLMFMVYCDPLTLVSNRRACEKKITDVEIDNHKSYGIFMFDINGLKYVNDHFGHACGDELIVRFANALKETFVSDDDFYGRFGGDEFIAIINNPYDKKEKEYLKNLEATVRKLNEQSNKEYNLVYSYGYIYREEGSYDNVWDTISKADSKMYDKKNRMKNVEKVQ